MKRSPRLIFTRVTGEPTFDAYIVRSRRTGLILGNVWRTSDAYALACCEGLKRGWCRYAGSGHVYRTRREAGMALT